MKIKTPCIKICKIQNGVCIGCKRTRFEIANWTKFSNKKREDVLIKLHLKIKDHVN